MMELMERPRTHTEPSLSKGLEANGMPKEQAIVIERAMANSGYFNREYWRKKFVESGMTQRMADTLVQIFSERALEVA